MQQRLSEVIARAHNKNVKTQEVLKGFENTLNSLVSGQCKPILLILTLINSMIIDKVKIIWCSEKFDTSDF